ncbi:MAG: phosphatase PAP2 family protein, partial [Rhodobacteraceae bacterium]|nr:phosphatase PAP2 family protein [Paracoccaceae bacterium]
SDRADYLDEADLQADHLHEYIIQFIGANQRDHPWTLELINCGLAIGNLVYMSYKAKYKRVRPSLICPGLIPPFGPPMHPAFPSGHSFLAHFITLILLEIPYIHQRFGVNRGPGAASGNVFARPTWLDLKGRSVIKSPLLLLAQRIAVNRERIGVHYPSDSSASRHLAASIWDMIIPGGRKKKDDKNEDNDNYIVVNISAGCPMFHLILQRAEAEWP